MANIVTGFAGRVVSAVGAIGSFYSDMNPSTLSGAIDIVVVQDANGNMSCSPFHVRFGKLKLLHASEKLVELTVNGQVIPFVMKLGEAGEAYFVIETPEGAPSEYATSPIPQPAEVKTDGMEPLQLDGSGPEPTSRPSSPSLRESASASALPPRHEFINKHGHERSLSASSSPMPNITPEHLLQNPSSGPLSDSAHPLSSEAIAVPITSSLPPTLPAAQAASPDNGSIRYLGTSPQDGWEWKWGEIPEKKETQGHHRLHVTEDFEADPDLQNHTLSKRISTPILRTPQAMSVSEKVDQFLATLPEDIPSVRPQSPPLPSTDDGGIFKMDSSPAKEADAARVSSKTPKSGIESPSQTTLGGISTQTPSGIPKFELSRCGPLKEFLLFPREDAEALFTKTVVSYESFSKNPDLLHDPLIVVRVQEEYHTWATAVPLLFSFAAFGKPLPSESLKRIESSQPEQSRYSFGISSWFGRSTSPIPASKSPPTSSSGLHQVTKAMSTMNMKEAAAAGLIAPKSPLSSTSIGAVPSSPSGSTVINTSSGNKVKHLYAKSLRLTSDQLKSLNLKYGRNTVTFSVVTSLQGRAECTASIFLWNHDAKIVVSDIDGTITKSDALGHIFTMVGRDWTHQGVAPLYTNIHRNGYVFLYLSSRAIGQASFTREYLQKVAQDSYQLPEGPVIVAPDRLFRAFTREVILRKPEEFKIACLRDIRKLFGSNSPFYAGFGNRITDALSYRSVDIPPSRIFTIDPSGEVKLELITSFRSSYVKLVDTVDQMFPPLSRKLDSEYTDFSFWKSDIPKLDELELPSATAAKAKNVSGVDADAKKKAGNRLSIIDSDDDEEDEEYYDEEDIEEDDEEGEVGGEFFLEDDGVHPSSLPKSPNNPLNPDAITPHSDEGSVPTPGGPLKWTESEIFRNDQQKLDDMDASPFI